MAEARIVVVEDESIVAMDLAATLRNLGCEVLAIVNNGRDAIDAAVKHRPDLVLMDIRLKGPMDGIEAAKRFTTGSRRRSCFSPRTATRRRSTARWAPRRTAIWSSRSMKRS